MDCSPPGSSVYGIFQASVMEWTVISFSRESSWPRNWTQVFCIAGRFFTAKLFVWITTNCGKFLKKWEYKTNYLTCLLRNLYASQEATVRTRHGTSNWFQIGKGVHQGCILSPCLFNFHAEYIMWNAGLDESQAGIKIARRNINNLRYAHNTTLMAESKKN